MSWEKDQNLSIFPELKKVGFDYIESVYSKLSDEFPVKAIQSIFYNSGITSLDNLEECLRHVKNIIDDCIKNKINVITFGSPTFRVGDKSKMDFFLSEVDKMIEDTGIVFCVEPVAKYYGSEYYTTLREIVQDLPNYKNIKSMLDIGNSMLEGQDIFSEYSLYSDYISHIHFASPGLNEITDFPIYRNFYNYLKESEYSGLITYEFANSNDSITAAKNFIEAVVSKFNCIEDLYSYAGTPTNQELKYFRDIFNRYETDKSTRHNYHEVYSPLFQNKKEVKDILEIGIYHGGSLRSWKEIFSDSEIVGLDFNTSYLFEKDRIKTLFVDQRDMDTFTRAFEELDHKTYDFISDDGSHLWDDTVNTFNTTLPYLNVGGWFVIEDIKLEHEDGWKEIVSNLPKNYKAFLLNMNPIGWNDEHHFYDNIALAVKRLS